MKSQIPPHVAEVLATLEAGGHSAFCVGGCVRDLLLGLTPGDWDVTSSARPEEVMALFAGHAIPTGLQHGTVTVRARHQNVEVTTFRLDGPYSDCRHPDVVRFSHCLEEDLSRRDFTVNAMALDLRGQLHDPFGGQEDLTEGRLRCVGEPRLRFQEDALRILRGLRFAAVLGLVPEEETDRALHSLRELLRHVAAERVRVELQKLLCGAGAAEILRRYVDVLGIWLPELLPMVGFDQRNKHHCYDVWEHTIHALDVVVPEPILRWTMLFHDMGKPKCFTVDEQGNGHFFNHFRKSCLLAEDILERLRFDNESRERILRLVQWHDREIARSKKGLRRALNRLGEKDLRLLLQVKRADNLAQHRDYRYRQKEIQRIEELLEEVLAEGSCFSLRQMAVNGRDLLELGFKGPDIGRTLERLLELVMEEKLPNENAALRAQAAAWRRE